MQRLACAMACEAEQSVCRGCLGHDRPMRSMFDLCLHEHFATFTKVEVKPWEGLSVLLCVECERALLECRRFRARCQRSDVLLRSSAPQMPLQSTQVKQASNTAGSIKSEIINDTVKESKVTFAITNEKLTLFITPKDIDSNFEENLICPFSCKTIYSRRNHLLTHLVRQHGVDESNFRIESQFYCQYSNCAYRIDSGKNKYFSSRKILKNHIANVHKAKDIVCDKCNEKFSLESALNRHKIVCSERYVCSTCGVQYKTNERLVVHLMRKHPDVHKEYKKQKNELRQRSKILNKRSSDESVRAKRLKVELNNESRSTQTSSKMTADSKAQTCSNTSEYMFDCSPKRTFATQTFESRAVECIRNDISLNSCVAHSPQSLKHTMPNDKVNYELSDVFSLAEERVHSSTIETQTVFEDLLSIRSQNSEDEIFETVSLSDIQTQTWPLEFGISSPVKQKNTSETQTNPFLTKLNAEELARGLNLSPDLSYKETQTCFCFLDSPKPSASLFNFPKSIFESATSSPSGCTSTETQTADADGMSRRRKDVLLSFHSTETQTCEESSLDCGKSLVI